MILVSELRKVSWRPHSSTHGVKASHGYIVRSCLKSEQFYFITKYQKTNKKQKKLNPKTKPPPKSQIELSNNILPPSS